ncbi:MAG: hypothetical protein M3N19_05045 [Candidatus Eremiobacteraeota bacterium]|nr:hypothetical protein [Candidatus Eremiobacteraeota bacterium]
MEIKLHKNALAILGIFCLLLLTAGAIRAADQRDFYVVNHGTEPIYYIHVSHISEEKWGEDVMAEDQVLMPDERVKIVFSGDSDLCYYDVQAVYKDGDKREKRNVNLCDVSSVEFVH